jgi:tRNA A22 N-methylase
MTRRSLLRLRAITELCPPAEVIVDVGADHGHVAHALGTIATEREPDRRGRRDVPWVVADGLTPFRRVDVAIIAGMGAHTILGILDAGPRPGTVIAHAQDDPGALRRGLAARGWRIDAERIAPEGPRYAEVLRLVDGIEPSTDLVLEFGPKLLSGDDPYLREHLLRRLWLIDDLVDKTRSTAGDRHLELLRRQAFLRDILRSRGWLRV